MRPDIGVHRPRALGAPGIRAFLESEGGDGMAEVTMEEVTKIYGGDVTAVDKMNLDIPYGEFVVFVGPSGCGKSTALRMIAGLEDISGGKVFIGDRVVNDLPPRERDIAMVFQNYALYPHMNVRENMGFALKLRKMDKSQINSRVQEAARILSIEHFLDRKPKALSGGQRQRAALRRAPAPGRAASLPAARRWGEREPQRAGGQGAVGGGGGCGGVGGEGGGGGG